MQVSIQINESHIFLPLIIERDMKKKELSALISLLEDPDNVVYTEIMNKLISLGNKAVPALENAWENSFDPLMQEKIENILHFIQFNDISEKMKQWKRSDDQSLLEGTLLICKYQYPDLDVEKVYKFLDLLKQDVWLEINETLTALEKIRVINHIIFEVHGFSGNTINFHAPQNSYLNNVIETKKGNPLSLAILYIIIAQHLEIPVYGVNLPEHFVLAYIDQNKLLPNISSVPNDDVLFYINPFSRGTVFSKKEIDSFLKQLKLNPKASYFAPCTNADIVTRLLQNLIISYKKLGYLNKVKELKQLQAILGKSE